MGMISFLSAGTPLHTSLANIPAQRKAKTGRVRRRSFRLAVSLQHHQAGGLTDVRTGDAQQGLAALQGGALGACTLAIGPEGGWSPRDREQLAAAGFEGLRLGPRILRTETAGIAAIAALQAMAGDLG